MTEASTLLLVEDDDDVRTVLALLLEYRGYTVDSASDGAEALSVIRNRGRPCLIILDLNMPGMDGWQLREELLRDPELADVPVVILSGIGEHRMASSVPAVARFNKPVDIGVLCEVIDRYCADAREK